MPEFFCREPDERIPVFRQPGPRFGGKSPGRFSSISGENGRGEAFSICRYRFRASLRNFCPLLLCSLNLIAPIAAYLKNWGKYFLWASNISSTIFLARVSDATKGLIVSANTAMS